MAHQGATLAQDRGRMEAQLQGLSEEVKSTREQLQREREAVRIKEKQVRHKMITEWLLVNYQHRVIVLLASNLYIVIFPYKHVLIINSACSYYK